MNAFAVPGGRALDWALAQRTEDALANLLLIQMGRVGNRSWKCFLPIGKLAQSMDLSVRTVQRKLRYLTLRGYIALIDDDVRRSTYCYRLCPNPCE